MTKVFFINYDVGSGIEYAGNMFYEILKERYDVYHYKSQNPSFIMLEEIVKQKPDIIVSNEFFSRGIEAIYSYKIMNPRVKIVQIFHDWQTLNSIYLEEKKDDKDLLKSYYLSNTNCVIYLNFKPKEQHWDARVKRLNPISAYFPVHSDDYKIITPWNERKGVCYIGNILPLRLSYEFLRELKKYPTLYIDCYGKSFEKDHINYYRLFNKLENINYLGMIQQEKVCEVLNRYKYFVLAHDVSSEIFLVILLQAILCGTIPIVSNDRSSNSFNYKWIDWADSFYFGYNNPKDMLQNLSRFIETDIDFSDISNDISRRSAEKFSFSKLKNIIFSSLEDL
jgi:hypothetical protein